MKARKRMVGAMAAACWLLLTLVAGAESVPLFARRKPWKLGGGDQRGDPSLEDVVNHQDVLAESCSSSRHAEACPDGTVMIFAGTMLGSCSPVGCIEPSGEDAFIHKGDEATMRRAVVTQTAARLEKDEHGEAVETYFRSLAMVFGQDEADHMTAVRKLLKQRPGKHDIAALRSALDEADRNGYAHSLLGKARDIVAWATSPVEVVAMDQESLLTSHKKCRQSASACPTDSTALVTKHAFTTGCEVATCPHVSVGTAAAAAAAETLAVVGEGGDDRAVWAASVEEKIPSLFLGPDLGSAHKKMKAAVKSRKQDQRSCNDILKAILAEGHLQDGDFDYAALNFFVGLAQHEGFEGNGIAKAETFLLQHKASTMLRAGAKKLMEGAGEAVIAVSTKTSKQAATIRHQAAQIHELQARTRTLEESVRILEERALASAQREAALLQDNATLTTKLEEERQEAEAFRNVSDERERELAIDLEALHGKSQKLDEDVARCEASSAEREGELTIELDALHGKSRRLGDDVARCEASSKTQQREGEQRVAAAAERHRSCVDEAMSLKRDIQTQVETQAVLESRLAAAAIDASTLRAEVADLSDAASAALAREQQITAVASAAEENARVVSEDLQTCREQEASLRNDMSVREAEWHTESTELESRLAAAAIDASTLRAEVAHLSDAASAAVAREQQIAAVASAAEENARVVFENLQTCREQEASLRDDMSLREVEWHTESTELESRLAAAATDASTLRAEVAHLSDAASAAVAREQQITATASAAEENARVRSEDLQTCREQETSLRNDMSVREAEWQAESTELEASAKTAQDIAATALKRAQRSERFLKDAEATIAEHESLATSLRMQIGKIRSQVGVAERKAEGLSHEAEEAKQQSRKTQQLLDLCWADFADLTSIMDELASSVAAGTDVSEGSGSLPATLEVGRVEDVHVAYKKLRPRFQDVRIMVDSFLKRLQTEQEELRKSSLPCASRTRIVQKDDRDQGGTEEAQAQSKARVGQEEVPDLRF